MRPVRTFFIAGAASLALAGAAIAAKEAKMHVMSVQLPDGSIEQVKYSGDVAPQVVFTPVALAAPEDMFAAAFGPDSPFAMMDRISAQMQRQSEAMLRQAATLAQQQPTNGSPVTATSFGTMPAGSFHYTMISTSSGGQGCTQSVQITSMGEGKQPKVINTSSGDCSVKPSQAPTPTALPNAPAVKQEAPITPVAFDPATQKAAKPHTPII